MCHRLFVCFGSFFSGSHRPEMDVPTFFLFSHAFGSFLAKKEYPRKTTKLEPESRLLQVCVSDWESETLLVGKSKHKERSIF